MTVAVVEEPGLTAPALGLNDTEKSFVVEVAVVRVHTAYSSALAQRPSEVLLMFDGYESQALW